MGDTRRALLEVHEDATEAAVDRKRNEAQGAIGFDFDSLYDQAEEVVPPKVPPRPEFAKKDKLAFEREMLGLYVSDHPLAGHEIPLAKHASTSIHDLLSSDDVNDGDQVTIAGLVTSVQHRVAKASGNPYGMITVEDFNGEVTVMFMGKTYTEFSSMLVAYRDELGMSVQTRAFLFGVYAAGLVPALLVGGSASDRWGRRAIVLPAVALSPLASVLLIVEHDSTIGLALARLIAGACSGVVFSAATAWVAEVSDSGAGARRAAVAL